MMSGAGGPLLCDLCGKEAVDGKSGHLYVKDIFTDREDEGHLEGWICLGPKCLARVAFIVDGNKWRREDLATIK